MDLRERERERERERKQMVRACSKNGRDKCIQNFGWKI